MGLAVALTLLALAALSAISIVVVAIRIGITPTPSSRRARRAILERIPRESTGVVYELGCGWGGLAVALARRLPDARVVAFEISPVPWLVSRVAAWISGRRNLEVRRRDFLRCDLRDADVVVGYLFTDGMRRLAPKLASELRAGVLVVSHVFRLPGWTPEEEAGAPGDSVLVYRAPGAA